MGRIYLRMPQCLQLGAFWERLSFRQGIVLTCGVIFLVILVIIFVQSKLDRLESSAPSAALPNAGGQLDKTLFSYGPNVHYGIVIDCGSSGSRVYVYIWPPHSGNPRDLLNIQQLKNQEHKPVVKKVTPGLDKFASHPEDASDYLKPLLEFAASHIPPEHHKETLLYILATAGMRLLSEESQKKILQDLQRDIPKDFDFVISENNFEVISGKQEGVYAWIAVNYVLQKFGHGEEEHPLIAVDVPGDNGEIKQHVRRRTVGMIDMGGGSMQIAFEITANIESIPKHLIAEFNLGCQSDDVDHTYRVYVTTFLGYGANEARSRYEQSLIPKAEKTFVTRTRRAAVLPPVLPAINVTTRNSPGAEGQMAEMVQDVLKKSKVTTRSPKLGNRRREPVSKGSTPPRTDPYKDIPDPCLQKGLTLPARDTAYIDKVTFTGTGDYHKCQKDLEPFLNQSHGCPEAPCSMNGVHQPEISFKNSEFYGFSELWYTMEDVFRIGGVYEHDVFDVQAKDFCEKKWSALMSLYNKGLYKKADDERFRMQCFKSAWMTTVLHQGLHFPTTYRNLISAQYIHNKDVQWTLGALIHRTRYLPLRDIEKMEMSHFKPSWVSTSHLFYNEYLIIICFIIVVMAILLYIKRLRLCTALPSSDLSRVPSMSYFMTEMDQVESGVRPMKTYTYP